MLKKAKVLSIFLIFLMAFALVGCTSSDGGDDKGQAKEQANGKGKPGEIIGEDYKIDIYTYYSGTTTYVLGAGLADLINKNSTWLKATALESPGPGQNMKMLKEDEKTRKNTIVNGFLYHAKNGVAPFEEPYTDLRELTSFGVSGNFFLTKDPKIKSLKDLDGKRVAVGTRPHIAQVDFPLLYLEKLGVKVKPEYLGHTDGATALRDGNVDALWTGGLVTDPDYKTWAGVPALAELLATEKIYFLSLDKKIHDEAMKELGIPLVPGMITVPPGGFDKEDQTEPLNLRSEATSWVAHKDLPDEVVEEFLRIIKENADEFAQLVPAGRYITPETMTSVGNPEDLHPAALKFYKENNMEVPGVEK